jgi:hypothetical protein
MKSSGIQNHAQLSEIRASARPRQQELLKEQSTGKLERNDLQSIRRARRQRLASCHLTVQQYYRNSATGIRGQSWGRGLYNKVTAPGFWPTITAQFFGGTSLLIIGLILSHAQVEHT